MAMLITNGLVVTFEPDALHGRIIENGAVAIEGGLIIDVGTTRELTARHPSASPLSTPRAGSSCPGSS